MVHVTFYFKCRISMKNQTHSILLKHNNKAVIRKISTIRINYQFQSPKHKSQNTLLTNVMIHKTTCTCFKLST